MKIFKLINKINFIIEYNKQKLEKYFFFNFENNNHQK